MNFIIYPNFKYKINQSKFEVPSQKISIKISDLSSMQFNIREKKNKCL